MNEKQSPAGKGYRMPAEWQRHKRTYLAWPHNQETWPFDLVKAQGEFLSLVLAIAKSEPTFVIVPNDEQQELFIDGIAKRRPDALSIETIILPTNDAWIRDYGPTFVSNGDDVAAIDWQYNCWGGKYPPFEDDQKFVRRLLENRESTYRFESALCLEGGAIEVDGAGLALCTKSCAMDPSRNPDWSLKEIETELRRSLGLTDVIWLQGDSIIGDDTDGHIDQLARFTPDQKLLYAWTENKDDPQRTKLLQNVSGLRDSLELVGGNWELNPLPLPSTIEYRGNQLPASYCNFYVTNRSVLVPQFGDQSADEQALEIIDVSFPDHETIGLSSYYLSCGLGSFHCLTQQEPDIESL